MEGKSRACLAALFNTEALEKVKLPHDVDAELVEDGGIGIASAEGESDSEEEAEVAAFRHKKGAYTSFSDEENSRAPAELSETEYRSLLTEHLKDRKREWLAAAIRARTRPLFEATLEKRPQQVQLPNEAQYSLGDHLAFQQMPPWAWQGSEHSPGIMNGRTLDAAQRRRMRKAKQRVKEAEALIRQGDPEAGRALEVARNDLITASQPKPPMPVPSQGAHHMALSQGLGLGPTLMHPTQNGHVAGGDRDDQVLDLGSGIKFAVPPFYDELAPSLGLPQLRDVEIAEEILASGLREADIKHLIEADQVWQQTRARWLADAQHPHWPPSKWGASRPRNQGARHRHYLGEVPAGQATPDGHHQLAEQHRPRSTSEARRQRAVDEDGWVLALPATPHPSGSEDDGPPRRRKTPPFPASLRAAIGAVKEEAMEGGLSVAKAPKTEVPVQLRPGLAPLLPRPPQMPPSSASPKPGGLPLLKISQGQIRMVPRDEAQLAQQQQQQISMKRLLRKELPKLDPTVVAREEAERVSKAWVNMVRKDMPRWHRQFTAANKKQVLEAKRTADFCQREARSRMVRSVKVARQAPMRTKRLARDMVIFWKKAEKEQAEQKKREERDALEARRREEEMREARRQQQRLNFLLTQTELYSHFMQTKLGGAGAVGPGGPVPVGTTALAEAAGPLAVEGRGGAVAEAEGEGGKVISEEERAEIEEMREEAIRAAELAASVAQRQTSAFDSESNRLRQGPEAAAGPGAEEAAYVPDGAQDMDLLNPSTMPTTSTVSQPTMFKGRLKEYQLKGLQWLVNLYEQGLNGILADEMGLGKTIQAMSFLSHLAEEKNIWGPFLVVAPASVLSNWADELARFLPDFRVLPYWGGLQERTVLRKNINPKRLYRRDAAFHALVTSYQLMVSDEKYFRRVKWQYMVLDEAQAIKSASSLRWKTLLSFNCRNRLLLTGTPIQNSMAELWALLHFIMPTLFDSHEQFNEWFSKGIEGHAEHGGTLNEHQLTRLHSILKPFMLRRVKKDVESEMTGKTEVTVPCPLSSRQKLLYSAIKHKISVADLFDSAGGHLNEKKVLHLMNIVIQLRKVCNHPELFERNEGRTFFHCGSVPPALPPPPFGELEDVYYAGHRNIISYQVPKLVYKEGMPCVPADASGSAQGFREKWLHSQLSVFSPDHIQRSLSLHGHDMESESSRGPARSGPFGFLHLAGLSAGEASYLARASLLERWLFSLLQRHVAAAELELEEDRQGMASAREGHAHGRREPTSAAHQLADEEMEAAGGEGDDARWRAVRRMLVIPTKGQAGFLRRRRPTGRWGGAEGSVFEALVRDCAEHMGDATGLLRATRGYTPSALAPQVDVWCPDRGFAYQRQEQLHQPWVKRLLLGWARTSEEGGPRMPDREHPLVEELGAREELQPLLSVPFRIFGAAPPMQTMDFAKMLTDSGKLHTLDRLLRQLRAGGHRVLVFAQMTKMLNILEDYMNYRKYKYLRLDGSSTITDRRDMVKDFQHRPDIFVFLLSTRAGGLGINLTAADTVIFYESDWNPTMDLQAMDRAHRLGQTREVTVYRLLCEGTVEEKIVARARQKNTVQQLVMTGGQAQADVFAAEEVVALLLDDAELERQLREQQARGKLQERGGRKKKGAGSFLGGAKGVRLDAEGSAFLEEDALPEKSAPRAAATEAPGPGGTAAGAPEEAAKAEAEAGPPPPKRGTKRKAGGEEKPAKPPKAPRPPRVRQPREPGERKRPGPKPRRPEGSPGGAPAERDPAAALDFSAVPLSAGDGAEAPSETPTVGGSSGTAQSGGMENGSVSASAEGGRALAIGGGGGGGGGRGSGASSRQKWGELGPPPKPRGRPKGPARARSGGESAPSTAVHTETSNGLGRGGHAEPAAEDGGQTMGGDCRGGSDREGGKPIGEKAMGPVVGVVARPRSRLSKKAKLHESSPAGQRDAGGDNPPLKRSKGSRRASAGEAEAAQADEIS